MRLPDEQEENGISTPVIYTIVTVSALVLIILVCVFASNSKNNSGKNKNVVQATPQPTEASEIAEETVEFSEEDKDIETLYKEHKLRSEDLDFWEMYDETETEVVVEPTESPSPTPTHEPTDEEKASDGKHVSVTYRDGTTEWIEISEDLPLHEYDFTKMKAINGQMVYYEGNKKTSRLGITLSKENGEIDFAALKEAGIDFVMLKVGARGYESGLITLDENFMTNIKNAKEAGLEVGVWFSSQAVNVTEAAEEAEFVINQLLPYQITYPVAFCMENIVNDTARTDLLDQEQKTQIAEAFLNDVEKAGYAGIIYGDKQWLLTEVLTEQLLKENDVWLTEQAPVPDYPYQFKMWEYAQGENISGVDGEVGYTISFVDYSRR